MHLSRCTCVYVDAVGCRTFSMAVSSDIVTRCTMHSEVTELVFRISKLHQFFRARELMVHVNIRHIAAFKFAVLVLGVAHWIGCLFYFLSRISNFSNAPNAATWVQQFDSNTLMSYNCTNNGSIFDLYGVTLYKGLNGISNLGYDPVVPER